MKSLNKTAWVQTGAARGGTFKTVLELQGQTSQLHTHTHTHNTFTMKSSLDVGDGSKVSAGRV